MGQKDPVSQAAAVPARPSPRVLLAEDDPEMRRMMAGALRRRGYEVQETGDGRELVEALVRAVTGADELRPHLIISDVRMPGHSGLEVLARLRRVDLATPVILITAFGDARTHEEARRLGASTLLDKPFDLDDLCGAVQSLAPVVSGGFLKS